MSNPAREALSRAVNRAIAEGAPVYVEIKPKPTNNQIRLQRRIASEYQMEAAKYHADFRSLRDDGGFALDTLAYYESQAEAHYWVARVMMGTQFE